MNRLKVGMLLFPDLTIQDFVGPYDVFVKVREFEVIVVGKTKDFIQAEGGLILAPTVSFEECPKVDILFVPGGRGVNGMLKDPVFLDFVRQQASSALYITSVCTGSLLLAAAGLLKGRKATTHWRSLALLRKFDVEVVEDRYVLDENIITGAGVTAGIDFGLALVAHIVGDNVAKLVQLMLEYNPSPPFNSGSPKTADEPVLQRAVELTSAIYEDRVKIIEELNHKKD